MQTGWPNPSASDRTFSLDLIVVTLFIKMLTFAVSQAFGFVGGLMFPFFFIGACAGNIAAQLTGLINN